jgi:hypothetical protein
MAGKDLYVTGGDGSINIAGNNNTANILQYEEFQRSLLYEVCLAIKEANIPLNEDDDFSTKMNSDWLEKLEYNRVKIYAEIFQQESYAFDQLEEVIKTFPNSVGMIRKVRHIYLFVEKDREVASEDGDYVLERVFEKLAKLVDESNRPVEKQMPLEEKERYIKLVMFYVFTRCQLLKKVDD